MKGKATMQRLNWLGALCLTTAACSAIQPAQMALPPELPARTESIAIEGMGGSTRGSFRVAGTSGSFTRSAQRLALFDELAVFDWGGTSFTLAGPPAVAAVCKMRQTTVNIGIVGFSPKPMAYECDFRIDGQPVAARFSLQESRDGTGTLTAQAQRRGLLQWPGSTLALRSVHQVQGSPLPLQTPIGYVFEAQGRAVGAIELNGLTPALWLPPAGDPQLRQAVLVAAVALAVFWDPAQLD
jgi:hypothetical protein